MVCCGVLRRHIRCGQFGCRGCAARQRQRQPGGAASPIVPLSVDERSVLLLRLIPMLYVPGSTSCTCWGPLEEVAHPAVKQATLAAKPRIDTILIENSPTLGKLRLSFAAHGFGRRYFFSSAAVNDRSTDRRCVMSRASARSRSEPLASSTPRASSCRTKSSNRSEASASRKVKRLYPMSSPV